jgi:hypothetical protein
VPLPFQCPYAGRVVDVEKVEKAFHKAFGPYRINKKREFFQIEVEQAIGLLEVISTEEATPEVNLELEKGLDQDSKDAAESYRPKKRPNLDFYEMGIPKDSTLHCIINAEQCVVVSNKKVLFREEEMSLTKATRLVKEIEHSVQPTPYWTFQGRSLSDIYNETYDGEG